MRLLDRYLLRELASPLVFCLGGFLIFWLAFDLFSELDKLQEARLRAGEIVWFYFMKLPELLVVVMPVGLLLAMLYALTHHARFNELTAMRAAGISVWRLSVPYLLVGLAFSLALFLVNEVWAPYGSASAEEILLNRIKRKPAESASPFRRIPLNNSRDRRIWLFDYNLATHEMRNVNVDWKLADGSTRVFAAERGIRSNGVWHFFNVRMHTDVPGNILPTRRVLTNELAMPEFTEKPDQIESEIKIGEKLNNWKKDRAEIPLAEILSYLKLHPNIEGRDRARLFTKLHGRLAAPWACLVVTLIAIPFGAASGRRNVFVGVASGIFIAFAYIILMQVGLALGAGGHLPAWLAAWLPNLIFGGAALWFMFRVR